MLRRTTVPPATTTLTLTCSTSLEAAATVGFVKTSQGSSNQALDLLPVPAIVKRQVILKVFTV
jgi:hypothetical protein